MTIVETTYGKLQGTTDGGVESYRGIPFAAPPVGDLRWRAPEPPHPWDGVRDATHFGPTAPQPRATVGVGMGTEQEHDEDCLFLNVWTPGADASARRPVMVWIHGGAFQSGSGSMGLYKGANLSARGDVVVVTINYRLGILGWLASEHLGGGNWGLLDQVQALRWVQENIAAFGGDPDNVTIFGESAGSVSVSTLLGTPSARGLFHKAIAESGGPGGFPMRFAERFVTALVEECEVDDVRDLRDKPLDDILAAQERLAERLGRLATPMAPVVDGATLPEQALDAIRDGLNAEVPVIVGTNRDEMTYFAMGDRKLTAGEEGVVRRRLARTVGEEGLDELIDAYAKARADAGLPTDDFSLWVAIESDRMFRIPSLRMAEAQSAVGANVYDYLFDWESPAAGGFLRSCHALEIPFVFGNLDQPMMNVFAGEGPEAENLSATMMDAWIAFARTGDPSGGTLGDWPTYDQKHRYTMRLGKVIETVSAPMDAERRAWEGRVTGRMSSA